MVEEYICKIGAGLIAFGICVTIAICWGAYQLGYIKASIDSEKE